MGCGTRPGSGGHTIKTFSPDDTESTLYVPDFIASTDGPGDMWMRIQTKWPGIFMAELTFSAEHVNTDCIGYDRYDPADHTTYVRIEAAQTYFDRLGPTK